MTTGLTLLSLFGTCPARTAPGKLRYQSTKLKNKKVNTKRIDLGVQASELSFVSDLDVYPRLSDVQPWDREDLFIKKLRQCCVMCDFRNSEKHLHNKLAKRAILCELIEYVVEAQGPLALGVYPEVVKMVSINGFRDLKPDKKPPYDYFIEDKAEPEASWPHLSLVYTFLDKFLNSPEFDWQAGRDHFGSHFVAELIRMLGSADPRERDSIRIIIESIYDKIPNVRRIILKHISDCLLTFAFETEEHNGVGDLLKVVFHAMPTMPNPKQFYTQVLLPLHKATTLPKFHAELVLAGLKCQKLTPSVAEPWIRGLITYWPKTNAVKEELFIAELEGLLENIRNEHFVRVHRALFTVLAQSTSSPHYKVANRALHLWSNPKITPLIEEYIYSIMPIMVPAFNIAAENWNPTTVSAASDALELCLKMSQKLVRELVELAGEDVDDPRTSRVRMSSEVEWHYGGEGSDPSSYDSSASDVRSAST